MRIYQYIFAAFALLSLFSTAMAQWQTNIEMAELLSCEIPVLEVNTTDAKEPTFTPVDPPENGMGHSIKAEKVTASMLIMQKGDTLYQSGEYVKGETGITIKVRGNTSAYAPIKPYKIKLQKKADLLLRDDDDKYADKDWILIDGNNLTTVVGLRVNQLLGMQWTPAYQFVNVVINGQYRGLYLLLEQIKRKAPGRLNVDKQTGYIFEHDAYWWNEDFFFQTEKGRYYTLKYPDPKDITEEQIDYIREITNEMEKAFVEGNYESLIDVSSFAKWILGHDILGTFDSGGSNIYLTKYDNTSESPIMMGNLWDFDSVTGSEGKWARAHTDPYTFFPSLFNSPNKAFVQEYIKVWYELSDTLFTDMETFLFDFIDSDLIHDLAKSRQMVMEVLGIDDWTWEDDAWLFINWFSARKQWLGKAIEELSKETTVKVTNLPPSENILHPYNLAGRPAKWGEKGIILYNGRKTMNTKR